MIERLEFFCAALGTVISTVFVLAAVAFVQIGRQTRIPRDCQLFLALAASMLVVSALFLATLVYGVGLWSEGLKYFPMVALVAPRIPTVLFGYFIIRFHFLRLMVERTAVTGAVLLGNLCF